MTKKKELELYLELQRAGVAFDYQQHLPFRACDLNSETSCAYVDYTIAKPWGYVLLECDEDQHRSYDASCDVRRDFDMAASVTLGSGHKLRVIRYNPDAYRVAGRTRVESKKDRIQRLLAVLDEDEPAGALERVFLCYDMGSAEAVLPQVAASWDMAARHVSRVV